MLLGGDERIRTADPHVANVVLSQLSYIPTIGFLKVCISQDAQKHKARFSCARDKVMFPANSVFRLALPALERSGLIVPPSCPAPAKVQAERVKVKGQSE